MFSYPKRFYFSTSKGARGNREVNENVLLLTECWDGWGGIWLRSQTAWRNIQEHLFMMIFCLQVNRNVIFCWRLLPPANINYIHQLEGIPLLGQACGSLLYNLESYLWTLLDTWYQFNIISIFGEYLSHCREKNNFHLIVNSGGFEAGALVIFT